MKVAKGIKTVRKEQDIKVRDDFGKLVNAVDLFVITELEETKGNNGFHLTFKTYSETFGTGGFETKLIVKNAPLSAAETFFLCSPSEAKIAAQMIGATLVSYKINNRTK